MFENYKTRKKIEDFRKDGLKLEAYDPTKQTIALVSRGGRHAELAFNLVDFDGKRQLAFSGDLITSDGEALSRVMKVMWSEELPAKFSVDDTLREQLFGDVPVEESIEPKAEAEVAPGAEHTENAVEAPVPQKPTPLYFRDMAAYVTGQPNEVIVTVKASYRIDNK